MQFVRRVGPPRDDTGGSALAPVACSREGGLRRVVSGFLHIALFAEEFLSPRSSRFQRRVSFQFCHDPSRQELSLDGSLTMPETIVPRKQSGGQGRGISH